MERVVDLHAAEIDQLRASTFGDGEQGERILERIGIVRDPVHVHRQRSQRSSSAGFGHSNGIKNGKRQVVRSRGADHFAFTHRGTVR